MTDTLPSPAPGGRDAPTRTDPDRPAPPVDLYVEAERRRAARALLRTPLLHADAHADDLALVRRHQRELVPMFADGLGYRLVVEPSLARLVKTHHHKTLTELIRERVVRQAKWEMLHTLKPVKRVARELGFEDVFHFSRLFKRSTGCSPAPRA